MPAIIIDSIIIVSFWVQQLLCSFACGFLGHHGYAGGHCQYTEHKRCKEVEPECGIVAGVDKGCTFIGQRREGGEAAAQAGDEEEVPFFIEPCAVGGPAVENAYQKATENVGNERSQRESAAVDSRSEFLREKTHTGADKTAGSGYYCCFNPVHKFLFFNISTNYA